MMDTAGASTPYSYADVTEIMRIGVDHVRVLIRGYGESLERTRDRDELSHRLLLRLVAQQVSREAELAGAMASLLREN